MRPTTSRSDRRPPAQFVGGPWCGHQYQPMPGQQYPLHFHIPTNDELHLYAAKQVDGCVQYRHMGRVLPGGAVIR